MSRPLIGVSTYLEESVRWGAWDLPAAVLPAGYHRLVRAAGGHAVLLPPDEEADAPALLERLDGLIVSGGPDVAPERYGAARDPRCGPEYEERDGWELALIRAALDTGVPLLGICRGLQLLNVALGGTLVQHLDGHSGPPGVFGTHPVRPVPGTLLAGALGEDELSVPTYHHQAVDRLGDGLVVSAYAPDGTVEAVERPGPSWVLGVQWHPEAGEDARTARALVTAAGRRRAENGATTA
ncbi:gamma-glutamyl-gamma-aminobutyrate hydrolase family protein [Streptomyces otsuchiensis]|uniref:gamma-glutamyl-gamma-aminobutyrate hydrolase family protein n=1 Tax=Streptomyces otsuchiensis TaxID=2681388 RepID=UPI001D13079A|nr:gamma-glutamyl-gamma-aminobutyrate hydrolase family protein [Streptomyces otsuchiensis]